MITFANSMKISILVFIPISILAILLFSSCASAPTPKKVVLTEEERNVKIIYNNQADNLRLRKYCNVLAVIPAHDNDHVRIEAVKAGGNVVEIMQTSSYSISEQQSYGYYYAPCTTSSGSTKVSVVYECHDDMDW